MTAREYYRSEYGYELQTTFFDDFAIAERFGVSAVNDTFRRAFAEWKDNYVYLTELVLILNHRIWRWYEKDNAMALAYHNAWCKADEYAANNLKGEELDYFYRTTD